MDKNQNRSVKTYVMRHEYTKFKQSIIGLVSILLIITPAFAHTLTLTDGRTIDNVTIAMRGQTLLARACDGTVTAFEKNQYTGWKKSPVNCEQNQARGKLVYTLKQGEVVLPNEGFLAIFPDKTRTLLITSRGEKQFVIYNGQEFGPYDEVGKDYHRQMAEQHFISFRRGTDSFVLDLTQSKEARLPGTDYMISNVCNYGSFAALYTFDQKKTQSLVLTTGQHYENLFGYPDHNCSDGEFSMIAKHPDPTTYRLFMHMKDDRWAEKGTEFGPFRWQDQSDQKIVYAGRTLYARAREMFVYDLLCWQGNYENQPWSESKTRFGCDKDNSVSVHFANGRYIVEVNDKVVASLTKEQAADWKTTIQGRAIQVKSAQRRLVFVAETPGGVDAFPLRENSDSSYGFDDFFIGIRPGFTTESIKVPVSESFRRPGQSYSWFYGGSDELPHGVQIKDRVITLANGRVYSLKSDDDMRLPVWILKNGFCFKLFGPSGPRLFCSNEKTYPNAFSPVLSEEKGKIVLRFLFLEGRSIFMAEENLRKS